MTDPKCRYDRGSLCLCFGEVSEWTTRGEDRRWLCKFHAQQELESLMIERRRKQWPDLKPE